MKTSNAISAGVIGALVMTAFGWMARTFMGMPVNLEMMLGTMFGLPEGPGTWMWGLVMHLTAGVVFALIYSWCFEHFSHHAGIGAGIGGEILGWGGVAREYFQRYRRPLMHTETNLADEKEAPRRLWKEFFNVRHVRNEGMPVNRLHLVFAARPDRLEFRLFGTDGTH